MFERCAIFVVGRMLLSPGTDSMEPQNGIDHSVAMAIAGATIYNTRTICADSTKCNQVSLNYTMSYTTSPHI